MITGRDISSYRNRHGTISQNVLAACNFDLEFIYVLSGWEGSAHDSKVLNDALSRRNGLKVPQGFFFSFLLNNFHFSLELLLPRIDLHVYLNYFFNFTYYLYCLLILLNFVCLIGKYFLVDCGFPNRRKFLAPFRSVHYHLQDFAGQGRDL